MPLMVWLLLIRWFNISPLGFDELLFVGE
jgi:hypothetical protein